MMVNVLNPSLAALLSDLYELTMAYGYWKSGLAEREAVFHLTFRKAPFDGQYVIAAGLSPPAIDYTSKSSNSATAISPISPSCPGDDGKPLFDRAFLVYSSAHAFHAGCRCHPRRHRCSSPGEPLIRVKGPLLQAQIRRIEALLNVINFQSLIATKAARICQAAAGAIRCWSSGSATRLKGSMGPVLSGQSRPPTSADASATSNVLAAKVFNIPAKGTHAHSWVMSFRFRASRV